jgi:hypothetical protein
MESKNIWATFGGVAPKRLRDYLGGKRKMSGMWCPRSEGNKSLQMVTSTRWGGSCL